MTSMPLLILQFVACALVILWSGTKVSHYGDAIAEKTGLGGTWIGLVLLATVTSLPELVTGASAVLYFDVIDIATGNAIGACLFNLAVLALLDAWHRDPLWVRIHQGHALAAAFSILQFALVALAILAGLMVPAVGWLGLSSLLFILVYVVAVRTVFVYERDRRVMPTSDPHEDTRAARDGLTGDIVRFVLAAAILVGAAAYLPGVAEQVALHTGLAQSFVGTLLVAAATTLPEIVVSIAAARIGALDMAAANLFGSNLVNMAILGVNDLLYSSGVMLAAVSHVHLVTLAAAIAMTGVAIVGLIARPRRKRYVLSWMAAVMAGLYLVGVILLGRLT